MDNIKDLIDETNQEDQDITTASEEETQKTTVEVDETEAQTETDIEPKYTVKYNGKEQELGVDDLKTYAQKGMNYDHVHNDLQETRRKASQNQAQLDGLTAALKARGYNGSAQEIMDELEAERRDIEPSLVRAEREEREAREQSELKAKDALREAEEIKREAVFAQDLAEIRGIDPNIKSLSELGDKFFKLRAAGIDNVDAYQIVSKLSNRQKSKESTGKDHLIPTGGGQARGELVDIPQGEKELWEDSFPNDTPKQLKERYNRAQKR